MSIAESNKDEVQFLRQQSSLSTLRIITCGSVDDGKSTLIGRLFYESGLITVDQLESLKIQSRKKSALESDIDFSLLVDGLSAEQEQGITIDIAYRYLSTSNRRIIIADSPGHEQYTRNMVTAASNADAAIIILDASAGLLRQTKRHSVICDLLGIKHIILAINKMDLIDYREDTFRLIESEYITFSKALNFSNLSIIPLSALYGDNILKISERLSWYKGPTLFQIMENIKPRRNNESVFVMPVQNVIRSKENLRSYTGTIMSGSCRVGDSVIILPGRKSAEISAIYTAGNASMCATQSEAISLLIDRDIDISRGDTVVSQDFNFDESRLFKASLVWLADTPGYIGRTYTLKIGTLEVAARVITIKHKIDTDNLGGLPAMDLVLNEAYSVEISTDRPIACVPYETNRNLGSLILVDRYSNRTLAGGMLKHSLRRGAHLFPDVPYIDKFARRQLNSHTSKAIWFTGISGSGKSTLAKALEERLFNEGIRTYILDGDNVRRGLNSDLGFTDADRIENVRRVAEVAKILVDAGVVVLCALISPFRAERDAARALFGEDEFVEVFVATPISVAEKRDKKSLYLKARRGDLPNFTGLDSVYEPPVNPEITVSTEELNTEQLVSILMNHISINKSH